MYETMPKHPFSKLVSEGHRVRLLHQIGRAAIAFCQDPVMRSKWYAAKYGQHHGEGITAAQAITAVRQARQRWGESEAHVLTTADLLPYSANTTRIHALAAYNGVVATLFTCLTRGELKRIVTAPERRAHNSTHYRDELAQLGILIGKPKPAPEGN